MRLKTFFGTTALAMSMIFFNAEAQEDIFTSDVGSVDISDPADHPRPFFFNTFVDATGKAKINNTFFKGDQFQFAIANFEGGSVFYYNPCYIEGAAASLAYTETYYGWKDNPWYGQDHFQTASLSFSAFTKRLDKWFWRAQVQFNLDGWEWDSDYLFYNILLWGRYEICSNWGIHLGFFAETGMQIDRIYPIIGFDWQIAERWKLSAVFPFDVALKYLLTESWTLSIAGRAFDSRHRVNKKQSHAGYLARYLNTGAEFMIRYERGAFEANIHAGSTLGGVYRISDRHNKNAHHYKLDPVGYAGAEIDVKF